MLSTIMQRIRKFLRTVGMRFRPAERECVYISVYAEENTRPERPTEEGHSSARYRWQIIVAPNDITPQTLRGKQCAIYELPERCLERAASDEAREKLPRQNIPRISILSREKPADRIFTRMLGKLQPVKVYKHIINVGAASKTPRELLEDNLLCTIHGWRKQNDPKQTSYGFCFEGARELVRDGVVKAPRFESDRQRFFQEVFEKVEMIENGNEPRGAMVDDLWDKKYQARDRTKQMA
ncbi:hypothetical protein K402DRAFT_212683 [Aulographum hederae CBS 113979]|uniref:Uncharacterized protein n=1 Tax=Aulographum hederae CBS 113979 TaxID=1176131 RepID=A0A6G1GM42_9PEZI|nr:hypothetical protein K402DRAFT_212683 [Aulographum hederae CBS 113979]